MLLTEFVDMYKEEGLPANSKLLETSVKLEDLFDAVSSIDEFAGIRPTYSTGDKTVIGFSIKSGNNENGIVYDMEHGKWRMVISDWYNLISRLQSSDYDPDDTAVELSPKSFMDMKDVESIPSSAWKELYDVLVAKTVEAKDVFYINTEIAGEVAVDPTYYMKNLSGNFTFRIFMATYDTTQDCILNNFKALKFDPDNLIKVPDEKTETTFDYDLVKNNGHYVIQFLFHSAYNTNAATYYYRPYFEYIPIPEGLVDTETA